MSDKRYEWLIADTHFNDEAIKKFEHRPTNYNEMIINNWNNVVAFDDRVYHLGDVIFSNASTLSEIMGRLSGKKILIMGNHDKDSRQWYMKKGFEFAVKTVIMEHQGKTYLLSHEPQKDLQGCDVNIHGHIHSWDSHRAEEVKDFYDLRKHWLLSIEKTGSNFKPVRLDLFIRDYQNAINNTVKLENNLGLPSSDMPLRLSIPLIKMAEEIDKKFIVEINDKDLKIDTYTNWREWSTRVTHLPTGIIAERNSEQIRASYKQKEACIKEIIEKLNENKSQS